MERNNILSAPVWDGLKTQELYEFWHKSHSGSMSDFFDFMTTPSVARGEFLNQLNVDLSRAGDVLTLVYSL